MLVAWGLLVSPAAMLGLERGNNDMIVLLLLMAAGGLLAHRARFGRSLAAGALVGGAAALKFYPLAALPLVLEKSSARRSLWLGVSLTLAFALFWWLEREAFAAALSMVPNTATARGYGVKVALFLWNNPTAAKGFVGAGMLSGLAVWAWLMIRERRHPIPLGWRAAGYMGGAGAWALCFFATFGYGYRAVLLLLPAGAWLHAACGSGRPARTSARVALVCLLYMLWLAALHPLMRGSLSVAGARASSFLLGLQSGLALGLTTYLAMVIARRAWRALRRVRAGG